jgi:hypothetical protein
MSEGTGSWGGWSDPDARLASDPGASGADLARIASSRPDLHAALAANPSTYPALLDWLRALHDPAVDAALAARSSSAPPPAAPSPYQAPAAAPYGAPAPAAPESGPYGTSAAYGAPASSSSSPYGAPASSYYGASAQTPYGTPASSSSTDWQGYAPAVATGSVPVLLEPQAPRRRRTGMWIGIGVAAALVVGGGVTAFAVVGSKIGGSPTPEAAVTKLLDGVAKKDALTLAGALSPAEFEPFRDAYTDLTDTKAAASAEATAAVRKTLDSLTITVEDLDTRSTTLDDGLAKVSVTDGTLTVDGDPDVIADVIAAAFQNADEDQLLGMDADDLRDELADELSDNLPYTLDLADDLRFEGDDPFLVTVQEGGKWYVSPLMTLGEYLTVSEGIERGDMPDPADAVVPKDPADAARQFAAALEKVPSGDLGPLANVLPLAERRFVTVYGQAFVDEAMAQEGADSGGSLDVTSSDFETVGQDGASAQVAPSDLAFEITDSWGDTTSFATDGRCLTVQGPYDDTHACTSDLPLLGSLGLDEFDLTAVREGNGWYVSVLGTVGSWLTTAELNARQLLDEGKLDDPDWWSSQLPDDVACSAFGSCY